MTDGSSAPGSDDDILALSFEDALGALEKVVTDLESGNIPLDKSIALYERGAKLRQHCEAKLAAAEEKVAQITAGAEGQVQGPPVRRRLSPWRQRKTSSFRPF